MNGSQQIHRPESLEQVSHGKKANTNKWGHRPMKERFRMQVNYIDVMRILLMSFFFICQTNNQCCGGCIEQSNSISNNRTK